LVLEKGRGVAFGLLTDLTSRPDLPWVRNAVGLGSVFEAVVSRTLPARGLVEIHAGGANLLTSDHSLTAGARVRVRIPAREVILATRPPEGVSLHNVLSGTVTNVHLDPAFEHAIVQVAVGELLLLAEITRDAVTTLGITPGGSIHALVKSVSIELA
jgi:molybdate transport system ATP-binding protein